MCYHCIIMDLESVNKHLLDFCRFYYKYLVFAILFDNCLNYLYANMLLDIFAQ